MDWGLYLAAGGVILACMVGLWLLSLAIRNASIVDIFWGAGFVIVAWLAALRSETTDWRGWLLTGLVTVWGVRLSLHIFLRNHAKPEDFRYAAWRAQYGQKWWWYSFFHVFALQGGLLWVISAPLVAASTARGASAPHVLDGLGVAVWLVGFIFEAGGDWQLAQFKKDPANRGKLMTSGLWRYTRHPNYFGDAAQWWGFWLIAAAGGAWWTVFAPLLMTWLLVRVSGVAMLERSMSARPGYAEYARRTSAFFPWPPRE
ncbi:MAG: DUF1295 domain-containing protein [Anaerolineales bacterium]